MKKKVLVILSIIILIVSLLTLFINLRMINSTKDQIVSIDSLSNDYDAIIVLGCKVNDNGPSLMLARRLDRGIDVYNKINTKVILTGDHGKNEYDEVNIMRDYVLDSIPSKDIFLDHAGFNTYDSIYRAKYIFNSQRIIIITQEYHLSRALYIASHLGIDAKGIMASDVPYKVIMFKNEVREVLSRDKNFVKVIFKPKSKYLGEKISLTGDGNINEGY